MYVEIDERAFRQLQLRAERERRDVRDEAALLLERNLLPVAENAVNVELVAAETTRR
jgi:hypothetical protein